MPRSARRPGLTTSGWSFWATGCWDWSMAEALLAADTGGARGASCATRFNALGPQGNLRRHVAREIGLGDVLKLGRSEMLTGGRPQRGAAGRCHGSGDRSGLSGRGVRRGARPWCCACGATGLPAVEPGCPRRQDQPAGMGASARHAPARPMSRRARSGPDHAAGLHGAGDAGKSGAVRGRDGRVEARWPSRRRHGRFWNGWKARRILIGKAGGHPSLLSGITAPQLSCGCRRGSSDLQYFPCENLGQSIARPALTISAERSRPSGRKQVATSPVMRKIAVDRPRGFPDPCKD